MPSLPATFWIASLAFFASPESAISSSVWSSVFKLAELSGYELQEMVALVTCNPARAAGLLDRGEILVGKRADLIAVQHLGGLPQVEHVWVRGQAVFSAHSNRVPCYSKQSGQQEGVSLC